MRCIDNSPSSFVVDVRQADVEACLKGVAARAAAEVHFGVDGEVGRKCDLQAAGGKAHRADEAGRPASGKKLLRVRSLPRAARRRQFDIEATVGAARCAVATAGRVRLAGVDYFLVLAYDVLPFDRMDAAEA